MRNDRRDRPSVLIVSAFFAPSRRVGARRPERMAAQLLERGWSVSVLTLDARHVKPLDPGLTPAKGVEVIRTGLFQPAEWLRRFGRGMFRRTPSPGSQGAAAGTSELRRSHVASRAVVSWARDVIEFPDPYCGWRWSAPRSVRGRSFDVVLATIPPYTTALVGRRIAARSGARFVIDYRDPWSESPGVVNAPSVRRSVRRRHRRAENSCLGAAGLVLSVSRTLCQRLSRRTRRPIVFLPNAIEVNHDAPAYPARPEGEFVYAGSLSYGRDLSALFRALVAAPSVYGGTSRLVYAGPHADVARAQASRAGAAERLNVVGDLPHGEALALLRGGKAGVVVVSKEYDYAIPGKIFDIIAAQRPIVLLGPPEFEASEMVDRYQIGWSCDPQDAGRLQEVVNAVMRGILPTPLPLDEFGYDATGDLLDRELRRLIASEPPATARTT